MAESLRIVIPVYDDWDSLKLLIERLDASLATASMRASLFVVDDGSLSSAPELVQGVLKSIDEIRVLTLRRNVGHQRAIAVGLAWIHEHQQSDLVVIMDADGEDDPSDVPRLVAKCREESFKRIIFARRTRRSEGLLFRVFYKLFKALYRLMTGMDMQVGNFSVIPFALVTRIVVISEIWNHYIGGVMKARLPWATMDAARGRRLSGHTKMNFVALVTHGLSAIAVSGEIFGVRMLIATSVLVLLAIVAIIVAVTLKLATDLAMPNWATSVVGISGLAIMQAISLSLFLVFIILGGRKTLDTIPLRDYQYFVMTSSVLYPHE